jgi:RNA polymerase sigma-70 factor (ECF subfamily)
MTSTSLTSPTLPFDVRRFTDESRPEHNVETSEQSLVRGAKDGDEKAFGALVRRHQERVFRLVGRFYRRREDVEDAAQETFLRAWNKLSTYRADAPFEHWLTRLCLNLCYQRLRRRRLDTEDLENAAEPIQPSHDPSAATDVRRLLARLEPRDRFILLLLDGEGWSVAEIAERLGWTRVNVKVRAHRARTKLRREVEQDILRSRT